MKDYLPAFITTLLVATILILLWVLAARQRVDTGTSGTPPDDANGIVAGTVVPTRTGLMQPPVDPTTTLTIASKSDLYITDWAATPNDRAAYRCPRCGYEVKGSGTWSLVTIEVAGQPSVVYRGCPRCLVRYLRTLPVPEMVETEDQR